MVEERKNRKVMIILGIVGGALLLAVIILLIFLLVKPGSGTGGLPTGSSSPTRDPLEHSHPHRDAVEHTHADSHADANPHTDTDADSAGHQHQGQLVHGHRRRSRATPTRLSLRTTPSTSSGARPTRHRSSSESARRTRRLGRSSTTCLRPVTAEDDFDYQIEFQCPKEQEIYALTAVGPGGQKSTKTITVVNTGDTE